MRQLSFGMPMNIAETIAECLNIADDSLTALAGAYTNEANLSALEKAIELIMACKGRLVVSGMGKSGIIGRKLVATFASTGTPALFLHPAEASHGDLGMLGEEASFRAIDLFELLRDIVHTHKRFPTHQ